MSASLKPLVDGPCRRPGVLVRIVIFIVLTVSFFALAKNGIEPDVALVVIAALVAATLKLSAVSAASDG